MWILLSLSMFFFSNALYLAIRQAQKNDVSIDVYSVAMFAIPALMQFFLAFFTNTPLLLPLPLLALIIGTAFLWSYLGNFFSQKGILYAPNPGYSLIIQKSYVVITTVAAAFLFDSSLNPTKIFGILLILIFAGFISLGEKTKESQFKWVVFSLLAHLCFAFGSLMSKQFLRMGLEPYTYLFYISGFVAVVNFLQSKRRQVQFDFSQKRWLILLVIGLSSLGFNLSMQFAYKLAPNPGYVVAFNTSSIMSVAVLSALIFKDKLSKQKLLGVLGVLAGLLVLAFS